MKRILLLLVLVLFGVNVANATYIDFASKAFEDADGKNMFNTTYSGIDITISTYDSVNWPLWGNPDDTISWNPGPSGGVDGLGVNDDEISNDGHFLNSEYLYISFSNETYVEHVDITDLFYKKNANGDFDFEQGSYWIETSSGWTDAIVFSQDNSSMTPYPASNGEYVLNINSDVLGLWFSGIDYSAKDDYSVRGIAVNAPVPEPATLLLFGTGLAGLAGYRRRQQAKKK